VNEEYPDAVIQLSQIFHDGRAGDLFVIPKSEWGFRKAKAATHGSIIFDDMRVPMLISGPTVPAGKFGVIRSCDIYPLLLKWFGINVPKNNYDGVDPFEKIEPESKEWQQLATLEQTAARGGKVRASGRMAALAREELNRRQILLKKLKAYEMELIRQPLKNDHVDIVRRAIELTEERVKRMQEITNRIL
jgi:arylsulfatase A-like enzyme